MKVTRKLLELYREQFDKNNRYKSLKITKALKGGVSSNDHFAVEMTFYTNKSSPVYLLNCVFFCKSISYLCD